MAQLAQNRSDKDITALAADFQRRNEPQFALALMAGFRHYLPGLRGLWTMSACSTSGDIIDASGNGLTLTDFGTTQVDLDGIVPCVYFNGTTQYLSHADAALLDISGAETYVDSSINGMTVGGWFKPASFDGAANDALMSKSNTTGNQRSWRVYINTPTDQKVGFSVSSNGTATKVLTSDGQLVVDRWHHIVCVFYPSTRMNIFINGVKSTTTVSVPASLYNSSAAFQIGAADAGSLLFNGHVSSCFLCCAALPDYMVFALYQQSRPAFGV